jgi:hypothetical protein
MINPIQIPAGTQLALCMVLGAVLAVLPRPSTALDVPTVGESAAVHEVMVPGLTPELELLYQDLLGHLLGGEPDHAARAADVLLKAFTLQYGEDSPLLATPSLYLGLIQLDRGETIDSVRHLNRAVESIERSHGQFDLRLMAPLRGLAIAHMETGQRASAVSALRRAQNLTHRHMGVYNTDQLPILDMLLTAAGNRARSGVTDPLLAFNVKVHEEAFGKDDPRIVPALLRMAEYMADRGKRIGSFRAKGAIDFRASINHSRRALTILEQHYGADDPRLIDTLRVIAETRLKRGFGKGDAVAAMRRAHDIVDTATASDVSERAHAKVELGDLYTLWDDHRSSEAYRDAWKVIPEGPKYDALRDELFGEPSRISTDSFNMWLRERPWRTDRVNFLEFGYVVRADGRARRFQTVEGNVPQSARQRLRSKLRRARFRPRMVDGDVVETEGLRVRREFSLF